MSMLFRNAAKLSRPADEMQKVLSEVDGNLNLLLQTRRGAHRYSPSSLASFGVVLCSPVFNGCTAVQCRFEMNNVTGCLGLVPCSTSLTKITCLHLLNTLKTIVIAQSIVNPRFSILVASSMPSNAIL